MLNLKQTKRLLAVSLPFVVSICWAATPPAKPTKPAEAKREAATPPSNKMMTREELRSCMKLKSGIVDLAAQLEQRKTELAADKLKLTSPSEDMKALRAEVEAAMAEYKAADQATQAHVKAIDEWNEEYKALESSTMKSAERQKKQMEEKRKALEAKNKSLLEQRNQKSSAYTALLDRYNAQAQASQSLVEAWNARNDALFNDGERLIEMRADYAADCANRRFKEEDEEAIKAGK